MTDNRYNAEDSHFHDQDRQALEALRAKLDHQRQEKKEAGNRPDHWMKCPKCDHDLEEIKMDVVMVDKCSGCDGIFFDAGEVALLMEAQKKNASIFRSIFG